MCYIIFQTNRGAKWKCRWRIENTHLALKRERLAALGSWSGVHTIHVNWASSTVIPEEMDWGWDMPDQDTCLLPSFNTVTVTVLQMRCISTSPACSRTIGSQCRLKSSTSPRCGKAPPYSSQWGLPLQIPVNNAFPRWDGTWCSQECSMLIQGESQLMTISWDFHIFKMMGISSVAPSLACETTGPTDWSFRCISSIL